MPDTTCATTPTRLLRATGRAALTLGVIAIAGGTVVAGHAALSSQREDAPPVEAAPRTTVQAIPLRLQGRFAVERRFAGQFEAPQRTALAFEEGGTVDAVLVEEGDRVARGAVLARLDTDLLRAERDRLVATRDGTAAQVELARRTDARQAELRERGFATDQRVDDTSLSLLQLQASLAQTEAAIRALDVRIGKATLRAPFDGVVGDRMLDAGAVAGPGVPVLDVLQDGDARFRAGLAPDVADGLSPGDPATVRSGARDLSARVVRIAPDLDPATRSRVVWLDVAADAAPPARAGGEVVVADQVAADPPGAWIPLAALRQSIRGTWEVLTLTPGDTVAAEAVEILHATGDRAFVRGTFAPGARVIDTGPHRVVPGEPVLVAGAEGASWGR
ncbi:efflux RND transporter periplasmic adaptor subunit [Jannaschia sp. LMIT008]|uniref:efflux RND transporter periplasmic adaptor subunit n=1 Tax=Jannaschia maritima TaxID=3032585 RepID=UPI00281200C8|nr:efflux RND transporter periplasmic adaptor subunit [Jannaschia sp. LMIT008]